MASQAIGSLYVALGLDSAAFTQGVKRVQSAAGRLQDNLERIGNSATAMGKRLSVVSASMAAAGAAAFALVKSTSDAAKEISIQSKLANASTREFQRWAAGARTVGIQNDKLADILKDVNDRIGDFQETGGGPMADFFENVAPKVGVTADQFKNLSGPQALQLYVDTLQKAGLSQQQMTFYMEAMASDATALIPLLMNGGAAMEGFGDAAEKSGAVMSDSAIRGAEEFQTKLRTFQDAVMGARNRLAEALIPIVNRFMDVLIADVIPAMDKVITKIEDLIGWFGGLPQPVQEAAAGIAAAIGVGGPVLLAIGALSQAFAVLIAATGPVGLFIAAAAAAIAAWQVWGDAIKAAVGAAIDFVTAKFQALMDFMQDIVDKAKEVKNAIVEALTVETSNPLNAVTGGVKGPISSGYNASADRGNDAIAPPNWTSAGADAAAGFANGVTSGAGSAYNAGAGLGASAEQGLRDQTETQSPSRLFQRIGTYLTDGLSLGINTGAANAVEATDDLGREISATADSASGGFDTFANSAQQAFQSVITGTQSVKDALKGLAASWASSHASSLLSAGASGLMSAFGLPGFANGTSHFRGGLAQINERGAEIVELPSGSKVFPAGLSKRMTDEGAGAGVLRVEVDKSDYFDVRVTQLADKAASKVGARVSAAQTNLLNQRTGSRTRY